MEGEVSNHDCADGAASMENNRCMRGKCRGGCGGGGGGRGVCDCRRGLRGGGGLRGVCGKGARGFDERSGVRVTWC